MEKPQGLFCKGATVKYCGKIIFSSRGREETLVFPLYGIIHCNVFNITNDGVSHKAYTVARLH